MPSTLDPRDWYAMLDDEDKLEIHQKHKQDEPDVIEARYKRDTDVDLEPPMFETTVPGTRTEIITARTRTNRITKNNGAKDDDEQ